MDVAVLPSLLDRAGVGIIPGGRDPGRVPSVEEYLLHHHRLSLQPNAEALIHRPVDRLGKRQQLGRGAAVIHQGEGVARRDPHAALPVSLREPGVLDEPRGGHLHPAVGRERRDRVDLSGVAPAPDELVERAGREHRVYEERADRPRVRVGGGEHHPPSTPPPQDRGPSAISWPYAPTFWIGVAPTVPGIPERHSIPAHPRSTAWRTSPSHSTPAPATSSTPSGASRNVTPPMATLRTRPGNPASATTRFEPPPMICTRSRRSRAAVSAWRSSASAVHSWKYRAGPPNPRVV